MNEFYIFATSAFYFWAIREIFFWVAVWQQNDYRFDRFILSLKAKSTRKELFYSAHALAKYILFLGYSIIVLNDKLTQVYQILVIVLYLYQAFLVLKDIYKNAFKKPLITPRSIIIIVFSLLTIFGFYALQLM